MKPGNSELGEAAFTCKEEINTKSMCHVSSKQTCTGISFGAPHSPSAVSFVSGKSNREKSVTL